METQRLAQAEPDFVNKISSALDECPAAVAAKETFLAALAKEVAPPPPKPSLAEAKEKERSGLKTARKLVIAADRKNDKADKAPRDVP